MCSSMEVQITGRQGYRDNKRAKRPYTNEIDQRAGIGVRLLPIGTVATRTSGTAKTVIPTSTPYWLSVKVSNGSASGKASTTTRRECREGN
jgi:hypothetical protein